MSLLIVLASIMSLILAVVTLFLIIKQRKTLGTRNIIESGPNVDQLEEAYERKEAYEREEAESSLNGCLVTLLIFIVIAIVILGLGIFLGLILPFVGLEWFFS